MAKDKREEEIRDIVREEMDKMPGSKRPTGVTIISILGFLLSLMMLITGVAAIGFSSFFGSAAEQTIGVSGFGSVFIVLGIIMLIVGIVGIIAFYLLWKMKKSGMMLVMIVGVLSIISSVLQMKTISASGLVGIILWIIILVYLFKKKDMFV